MENDKDSAVDFGAFDTMTPFSAGSDDDLVAAVRKIIGGVNPNGTQPESEKPIGKPYKAVVPSEASDTSDDSEKPVKTKVDGRSRDYRSTVSRISDGKKKKTGEGLDGRTKSYKETMKRIASRRTKSKEE